MFRKLLLITMFLCVIPAHPAVTVVVNGSNHTIPQTNEKGWGTNVTAWIQAISQFTLQPSGGTFTLTAEVNTGATYGFKVPYIKTATTAPASVGVLRLAVADDVVWRNNANSGDLLLSVDGSDNLTYNGAVVATGATGTFQDSTFSIYDNGDNTKLIAFQASGITTATTRTITMPDANVNLGALVNANIDAAAAIALSKLAVTTANRVLLSDGSGLISPSSVTNTTLSYLDATSSIQTQLDARIAKSIGTTKGDTIVFTGSGTPVRQGIGTDGYVLTADSAQTNGLKWADASAVSATNIKNYAQNAEFRFWQRQTPGSITARQDDAYGPDRWYTLTSGGAVNVGVARVAEVISGSPSQYVAQIRQDDATVRQFGLAQILEFARIVELRGKAVAMSFYARTDSTEITTVRACIGEWTGTADTVTSDVVSSWGATPTWIGSFACLNTPGDITISSTMAQFTVTGTVGASANNLVLVIWTPNTEADNDDLYLTQVQLVQGAAALAWDKVALTYDQDFDEVRRFYQKSYPVDILPGTVTRDGALTNRIQASATFTLDVNARMTPEMRTIPTVLIWSTSGTAGNVGLDGGAGVAGAGILISTAGFAIESNVAAARSLDSIMEVHFTANAEL